MNEQLIKKSGKNLFSIVLIVLVAIFASSTAYFFAKSTTGKPQEQKTTEKTATSTPVTATDTTKSTTQNSTPKTTSIADTATHVSAPAQTYKVEQGDTLFVTASKFNLGWETVATANNLKEPYKILVGQVLVIPTLDATTKEVRIDFKTDDAAVATIQADADSGKQSQRLDPVYTSQVDIAKSFGLTKNDSFVLKSKEEQKGQAIVVASSDSANFQIELYQPKVLGTKGIWAIKSVYQAK